MEARVKVLEQQKAREMSDLQQEKEMELERLQREKAELELKRDELESSSVKDKVRGEGRVGRTGEQLSEGQSEGEGRTN